VQIEKCLANTNSWAIYKQLAGSNEALNRENSIEIFEKSARKSKRN